MSSNKFIPAERIEMKVVVLAYNDIGCRCLELLLRAGHTVEAVFTHKDDPNENIYFDSVEEIAKKKGIPCYTPDDINAAENVKIIRDAAPQAIFSFYYRKLISREIIDIPARGAINLHGSLLPKYRGRCPVNWAIINGESETGVTLHYITEKPDAGPVIGRRRLSIGVDDTAHTVLNKLAVEAVKLLEEALPKIEAGTVVAIPQNEKEATTFPRRRPEDGLINWDLSSLKIYNLIRALTHPFPGAFSYLRRKKLFIWSAGVFVGLDFEGDIKSGTMLIHDGKLLIKTGAGLIAPVKLQIEGGCEMFAENFVKENGIISGEQLTDK